MLHELKTRRPYFTHIINGWKTFEARKDDRNFKPGDAIKLVEILDVAYGLGPTHPTGRELLCNITYKLRGEEFGIMPGYCILGIEVVAKSAKLHLIKRALLWIKNKFN